MKKSKLLVTDTDELDIILHALGSHQEFLFGLEGLKDRDQELIENQLAKLNDLAARIRKMI